MYTKAFIYNKDSNGKELGLKYNIGDRCMTEDQDGIWQDYKKAIMEGIDRAIERGNTDVDVLYIMKELLDDGVVRPNKKTIEEYFEEQDRLNKK